MDYTESNGKIDGQVSQTESPANKIEKILNSRFNSEDNVSADENSSIFSELSILTNENGNYIWKEIARWIKYEENVEEGGGRWSKPHVSTVSLHSLLELRNCLMSGVVILDSKASSLEEIADQFVNTLLKREDITKDEAIRVRDVILVRHKHQYQKADNKNKAFMRSMADMRNHSNNSLFQSNNKLNSVSTENVLNRVSSTSVLNQDIKYLDKLSAVNSRDNSCNDLLVKFNNAFMRKIPVGTQANNIMVAEVGFLDRHLAGLIRLKTACSMGNITEVAVPSKFVFIFMGPHRYRGKYIQVGRAFATIMSDQVFHSVALRAQNTDILLAGVDEYLDAVTVLPPALWDPNIRIEPPEHTPTQESRKLQSHHSIDPEFHKDLESVSDIEEENEREKNGLVRTGRLFGGLFKDIRRKAPFYWSDFTDALSLQSIASVTFLYFACLSPIITFGGLLGDATGNNIATIESLMSGAVCGIIYGLFSGQPLTIMGSTGPVLVFESILFDFCRSHALNYLSLRLWVGIWTSLILLIMVAFDASVFVCYITRFTEENFATLISVIFIYKAIEKLIEIETNFPLNTNPTVDLNYNCWCLYSDSSKKTFPLQVTKPNSTAIEYCLSTNGTLTGMGCQTPHYKSDVFLLSVLLFIATYLLSISLKEFRMKTFFPSKYRQLISDFAVPIAIISVTALDNWIGIETPKLLVPNDFKPTSPDRGWIISPFVVENPIWLSFAAGIPALLATILLFMDQQITAVIINRKENKLKKGCGYHLDLFILSILILICSVFGLPWFVAATVLSMTHVDSLKVLSETAAPGDRPQFLGVREQRVTHILIFILCGLSIFFTQFLQRIPMPVLYGVFLYMGYSSLKGSQFFERILILIMPQKYQPDYLFLRQVQTRRVHLFTTIQLICFAMLWIIKSYKPTSIGFPLMLVIMLFIRKCLDFVFTREELKILDDIMPESTKRKLKEEKEKKSIKNKELTKTKFKEQLRNQRIRKQSLSLDPKVKAEILKIQPSIDCKSDNLQQINISEQLGLSGAWKQISQQNLYNRSKANVSISDAQTEDEKMNLKQSNDDFNKDNNDCNDCNDCGITIRIN